MKRAVRTLVLVVAVACTCVAMAAPISTKLNDGPIPFCSPGHCHPTG
jgi:hypothetical protein